MLKSRSDGQSAAARRTPGPEALARIARLEVKAREVVEGFLSGMHRSPYSGQSVEFLQHREYVAGDETRHIDWKVWSKTDKYYVKLFEEETNLRTVLLVDGSESMKFGGTANKPSKFDYACTVAASLAYLLLRQQDSVGVVTFDSAVRNVVPLRSKGTHLHTVLAALRNDDPQKKTDLFGVLRRVAEDHSRRGMIVVISDLLADRDGLFRGLKLLRHRGHDVLVFHVLDDQELDFDFSGTTRFQGLEESGEVTCDPRSLREGYLAAMQEYLDYVRRECARNRIDYQLVRTSEHLDAALAKFLSARLGMRHGGRG